MTFGISVVYTNCSPTGFGTFNSTLSGETLSSSTTPTPEPMGSQKVFMASGKLGRTTLSCDGGQTWIHDQSDDDTLRCWGPAGDPLTVECDHDPRSNTGLSADAGWFFASYGWGFNGTVRRTHDGVHWETVKSDGWGGGLAYLKGSLLLAWGDGSISTNQGTDWTAMGNSQFESLNHAFLQKIGDNVIAHGRSGSRVSGDQGATWNPIPSTTNLGFTTSGKGRMVSISVNVGANGANNTGISSISTDNGLTWSVNEIWSAPGDAVYGAIFDGTNFVHWTMGKVWKSLDGITWTSTPTVGAPPWDFIVNYNPDTKTYAAIMTNWGSWYDKQKAYRSDDGITWVELSPTAFKGGHPMAYLVVSDMESKYCH